MSITVRYWAAVRAVAGSREESVETGTPLSIEGLLDLLIDKHGSPDFARILQGCSILIDGRSVARAARAETRVERGETVEFLPPFAGG